MAPGAVSLSIDSIMGVIPDAPQNYGIVLEPSKPALPLDVEERPEVFNFRKDADRIDMNLFDPVQPFDRMTQQPATTGPAVSSKRRERQPRD